MQVVCKDTEANGDSSVWFYDAGQYIRRDERGDIRASINGEEITDPQTLWDARIKATGAAPNQENISNPATGKVIRLKPTEATFALFKHWQKVQSCQQ